MRKYSSILLILVIISSVFTGCTKETNSENTVADINEYLIYDEDIEDEVIEREIQNKNIEKAKEIGFVSDRTAKESYIDYLNAVEEDFSEEDLTEDMERYIKGLERSSWGEITKNEAFNIVIRNRVLYQEAEKQGYERISKDDVLETFEKDDKVNDEFLAGENIESYNKMMDYQDEVVREYGFESFDDYRNSRIDKIIESTMVSSMIDRFRFEMGRKIQDEKLKDYEKNAYINNVWEDYTEYLLKNSNIEILKDEYTIEYYGEEWEHGDMDLSVN